MPKAKKQLKGATAKRKTTRRKVTDRRSNIVGNFRGKEDAFLTAVRNGMIKFSESPFKKK